MKIDLEKKNPNKTKIQKQIHIIHIHIRNTVRFIAHVLTQISYVAYAHAHIHERTHKKERKKKRIMQFIHIYSV